MNDKLIVAFAFIIGASWGSFLYTFIIRYTNGMYTKNPCHALTYPSHCPHCHEKIKPVYLIPVIGYCLTKGCCAYCKKPVSLLYPLSELFCGIVAV
ncbi:MAG TPA: prepilin peptidase, partial [Spirochaetota bacterium]|nr:prepilin peptidase [Spirochaetota bacterium]